MTSLIDQNSIAVLTNRQRKEIKEGALEALKQSILDKGLMHPVVLKREPYTDELDITYEYVLVAGERRLRAIRKIHQEEKLFNCDGLIVEPGKVPYVLVTDLDEVQIREAELEENICREDLTWQERMQALSDIHAMRQARNPAQTLKDTAEELAVSETKLTPGRSAPESIRKDISRAQIISQHLDDPSVARARDEKEAWSIITRRMEADFAAKLADETAKSPTKHRCVHADFGEIKTPPKERLFDVIIADPPYGMEAGSFGDAAKLAHRYEDSVASAMEFNEMVLRKGFEMTRDRAAIFVFCDIEFFLRLRDLSEDIGWKPRRTPLVWYKGSMGHISGIYGFRRSYELIMIAFKGDFEMTKLTSDVIDVNAVRDKVHAAQKPVELYVRLIGMSCHAGARVLDPCCGSGTIFTAAKIMHVVATGVEKDLETYKQAKVAMEACNAGIGDL